MTEQSETNQLLRDIRDQQREALALQREHIAMAQRQLERAERLNDRAEAMQGRAGNALKSLMWIVLPLLALLLALMLWPYLRYMLG